MKKRTILAAGVLVLFLSGCHMFNTDPGGGVGELGLLTPPASTTEQITGDWDCQTATDTTSSCQDVYEVQLSAGTTLNFGTSEVGGNTASQIAIYGPGDTVGGINLLTGLAMAFRCTPTANCGAHGAGESYSGFVVPTTGVYQFAVIRHHGASCGWTGTYTASLDASAGFTILGQTMDDATVQDDSWTCDD